MKRLLIAMLFLATALMAKSPSLANFRNIEMKKKGNIQIDFPHFLNLTNYLSKKNFKSYSTPQDRDQILILINGATSSVITQGEDFTITVSFSDGASSASIQTFVDIDNNQQLDENIDFDTDDSMNIVDNDINDLNPADGMYETVVSAGEDGGPQLVGNISLIFKAEDSGGESLAFLHINPLESDYSVSGSVIPPFENIVVYARSTESNNVLMTLTDADGNYQLFVPESGMYNIFSFDPMGVAGDYICNSQYYNVEINGHIIGYDFEFIEGNSTIEGYVYDMQNNPIPNVRVEMSMNANNISVETDENGFYTQNLVARAWKVSINFQDLMPQYLATATVVVVLEENQTVQQDFHVYETDSQISGTVYFDDTVAANIKVVAKNYNEWTQSFSQENGYFPLSVSSELDQNGGYFVFIPYWDLPEDFYVDEQYSNVNSGTTGLEFHIHQATGGIEGYVYDSQTNEPLNNAWLWASSENHSNSYFTDEEGHFHLALPNGEYFISVNKDDYYNHVTDGIVIQDNMVEMNFYLDPIVYTGLIEGVVTDQMTGHGIPYVYISIENNEYSHDTSTNQNGYYSMDLPNGQFEMYFDKENYESLSMDNIVVNNDEQTIDAVLVPVLSPRIEGYIYDETTNEPLENVNILIINSDNGYESNIASNANGYFEQYLPIGRYSLTASLEGYQSQTIEDIVLNDSEYTTEIYLVPSDANDEDIVEIRESMLSQNYPNPFNPTTTIKFYIKKGETGNVSIYNVKGELVKSYPTLNEGQHKIVWNGTDNFGKKVSSGIYLYKLSIAGKTKAVKKCIMLK